MGPSDVLCDVGYLPYGKRQHKGAERDPSSGTGAHCTLYCMCTAHYTDSTLYTILTPHCTPNPSGTGAHTRDPRAPLTPLTLTFTLTCECPSPISRPANPPLPRPHNPLPPSRGGRCPPCHPISISFPTGATALLTKVTASFTEENVSLTRVTASLARETAPLARKTAFSLGRACPPLQNQTPSLETQTRG